MVVPNTLLFPLMTILDLLLFISSVKKSNVCAIFQAYKTFVENYIGKKIKILCSHNGGEFKSRVFNAFCELHGVTHQFTIFYSPQQNGIFEQKNMTSMEFAQSML
jgi:transposase InsO family protein